MAVNLTTITYGDRIFTTGDSVLLRATVTLTRKKRGGSASVTLADPRLELFNSIQLPARSARIPLLIAWGPQGRQRRIFAGYVARVESVWPGKVLEVSAVDNSKAAKLTARARNRSGVSLEQIAQEVAAALSVPLDATGAALSALRPYSSVIQHGETDWDTLQRLAAGVGLDVWLETDRLVVRPSGASDGVPPRIKAGDNLVSWTCTVEAKTRSTTSNVYNLRGEPVVEGSTDEAAARLVALSRTGVVLAAEDAPSYTDQTVEEALRAGARQRKVFVGRVVVAPGLPEATPRGALFLEGLGARVDGPWPVETITHDLTGDRTTADVYSDGAD